jgi:protein-S-isoprenylcysteine O-methyltransferase Ste14
MSLTPSFAIGIWNAWILTIVLYAAAFIPFAMSNEKAEQRMEGEPQGSEQNRVSKVVQIITHVIIMPLTLIYSIFLPLQIGTWWFYVGLLVYLIGLIMVLMGSISFSTAPIDIPMSNGVYAISRHPLYLGVFLAFFGIGISCASWVFLLCALVWIAAWVVGVEEEERFLIEKYGDTYRQYMTRTPRWIGIPKNM